MFELHELNLTEVAREVSSGVIAAYASDVDRLARFPSESIQALRERGLLGAAIPKELGGLGAGADVLSAVAEILGRACGATAMIWAMHQVQIACLSLHGVDSDDIRAILHEAATSQWLVASVTSEQGIGGDLGSSATAVRATDDVSTYYVDKYAPTVSYGEYADALLITARRSPDSPPGDQVAVIARRHEVTLEPLGGWDPLGMRGTCSPGFHVQARFGSGQIIPEPFGDVNARTMVPMSHVLWASVWVGLAKEALQRATQYGRRKAQAANGKLHPNVSLAEAHWRLAAVQAQLAEAVATAAALIESSRRPTTRHTAQFNALKLSASETCLDVALLALRCCGMAGYSERGPFSIGRILRDLLSAPLMIANDRLLVTNSLLAFLDRG